MSTNAGTQYILPLVLNWSMKSCLNEGSDVTNDWFRPRNSRAPSKSETAQTSRQISFPSPNDPIPLRDKSKHGCGKNSCALKRSGVVLPLSIICSSYQFFSASFSTTSTSRIFVLIIEMADPLSTASALLTLVVFAFQSSTALYQVIESFQTNKKTIRDLKEELEALTGVLKSLQEAVAESDVDLTALKLPLLRCGKACKDFEAVIVKCTAHSAGARTSFRDWAKLQYMGDNIDGFRNMLAGYKSTITVALGDANM